MKHRIQNLAAAMMLSLISVSALAESQPEFRPALLGSGRRSLINLIDTQSLMKRGQGDAVLMFSLGISQNGYGYLWQTYRATPNSELLARELMGRASQAEYEPAVYKQQRIGVLVCGTVSFSIVAGKPHLRIFLNQEADELARAKDFIAPQLAFALGNPKFEGVYYPGHVMTGPGTAAITMDIDVNGKVQSASVSYEFPKDKGFGTEAADGLRKGVFIPAFRNGKAVPCRFTLPIIFSSTKRSSKTG